MDKKKTIAIIDDDIRIVEAVSDYLNSKGFHVKGFTRAEELFHYLSKAKPDLLILDLMLPGIHGFEICKKIKEKEELSSIAIIILSAANDEPDKIFGLDIGADDYIVKPFSLNELNARINAVLRRRETEEVKEKKITIYNMVEIDFQKYEVAVCGKKVALTSTEFKILECLSLRIGRVFTRQKLLDYLWGEEKIVIDRTIDVHIRHLREKLGQAGKLIINVRGVGYKLDQEAS